jgi:VWFA-related protein
MRSRTRAASFLATLLLAGLSGLASGPRAASQEGALETFGETLDVVVVEVQAVVTDRDGRRVTGLEREDFRLLVDGRETAIEYFSEVLDGRELPAAAGGTVTEVPSEVLEPSADAAAALAPGDPVVTNHLVFVDDYFAIRSYRDVVLRGIEERLPELPPEDRMAVVAFDGEEIDVLTPWSTSREEAARALARASKRPAHGLLRAHERRRRGEDGPWTDPVVQEDELRRVLTAVRSALRMMPRPDGRKIVLLLGGGWPIRSLVPTTEEAEGSPFRGLPTTSTREGRFDDRTLVHHLADAANLLGYTLYPVDVQGLRSEQSQAAADEVATDQETGLAQVGTSPFTGEIFRQGTLRFLAHTTGGRALLYDERARALEAVVADTRTYYSLGFSPRLQGDGSRHEVRLEVRREGLRVRARTGFRDVSRTEELDLLAESALRFGGVEGAGGGGPAAVPEEGKLVVSLGEARRRARGTMEVPLRVDVPWGEVTLLPGKGGLVAHLEIRVAVRDREGSVSEMARIPVPLERERRPDPRTVLRWETDLTLRRERHDLVVTLYDALSGQVMTRVVSVEP